MLNEKKEHLREEQKKKKKTIWQKLFFFCFLYRSGRTLYSIAFSIIVALCIKIKSEKNLAYLFTVCYKLEEKRVLKYIILQKNIVKMGSFELNIDLSKKEDIPIPTLVVEELNDDLAVVGIACRFPGGSNSIDEFWSNLVEQRDCVRPVPNDRWNTDYYTDPLSNELHLPAKIPSSRCGWIDFVGEFDYETFSISKREAENMDPQQKILLEVTLQALEDSGIQYAGSKTGVYVGIGQAEQFELTTADLESINPYSVTGSALSIPSNRLSYCFDLRGPSMSIDTACSSSLTAFHLACQAIRDGTCSSAVVGGVNILMNPSTVIQFSQLGVLSPDGMCQSFSNKANGYVRSEGCGVVIIKPLKQAQIDNNHIYCRIRGSAINQDGHQSPSLTMPSSQAQIEVFQMACQNGNVNPTEIFYAEAHATGTRVGDPTEGNELFYLFFLFQTNKYLFFIF
jgi:acyl transferase domain-containing protein